MGKEKEPHALVVYTMDKTERKVPVSFIKKFDRDNYKRNHQYLVFWSKDPKKTPADMEKVVGSIPEYNSKEDEPVTEDAEGYYRATVSVVKDSLDELERHLQEKRPRKVPAKLLAQSSFDESIGNPSKKISGSSKERREFVRRSHHTSLENLTGVKDKLHLNPFNTGILKNEGGDRQAKEKQPKKMPKEKTNEKKSHKRNSGEQGKANETSIHVDDAKKMKQECKKSERGGRTTKGADLEKKELSEMGTKAVKTDVRSPGETSMKGKKVEEAKITGKSSKDKLDMALSVYDDLLTVSAGKSTASSKVRGDSSDDASVSSKLEGTYVAHFATPQLGQSSDEHSAPATDKIKSKKSKKRRTRKRISSTDDDSDEFVSPKRYRAALDEVAKLRAENYKNKALIERFQNRLLDCTCGGGIPMTGASKTYPANDLKTSRQEKGYEKPVANPSRQEEGYEKLVANPSRQEEGYEKPVANPSRQEEGYEKPVANPIRGVKKLEEKNVTRTDSIKLLDDLPGYESDRSSDEQEIDRLWGLDDLKDSDSTKDNMKPDPKINCATSSSKSSRDEGMAANKQKGPLEDGTVKRAANGESEMTGEVDDEPEYEFYPGRIISSKQMKDLWTNKTIKSGPKGDSSFVKVVSVMAWGQQHLASCVVKGKKLKDGMPSSKPKLDDVRLTAVRNLLKKRLERELGSTVTLDDPRLKQRRINDFIRDKIKTLRIAGFGQPGKDEKPIGADQDGATPKGEDSEE